MVLKVYQKLIITFQHFVGNNPNIPLVFNPILTGLFQTKFLLGGQNLTPPSDLGPEGADRREILHGCEDTSKEYCYGKKIAENGLFIILL